jgi:O-antigen/teichoic acid export membrane protein
VSPHAVESLTDKEHQAGAQRRPGAFSGLKRRLAWRPGERARRALRAGFWSGTGFATSQALRMGRAVVLTYVLPEAAFGVWRVLSSIQAGLQMVSDLGIGPAIIQNPRGDEREFLDTAFTLQVARGVVLWLISCLVAWPCSILLQNPQLAWLIPATALSILIGGFASTAAWTLTRRMHLRPVTILNISSEVAGAIVALVWGWLSPSVWALVAGAVAVSVANVTGSYIIAERRNGFAWETHARRALIHFAVGTLLSTATWFIASQGEGLLLADRLTKALGTDEAMKRLGVLSMALMLASTASAAASQMISQVIYPSISKAMASSSAEALGQYRKARALVLGLNLAMSLTLMLGSGLIVELLLPDKYREAGWMLRLLAVRSTFEVAQTLPSVLLMSVAKLKYAVIANCVRVVMLVVGVPLAFAANGLEGAVWGLSVLSLPTAAVFVWGLSRHYPALVRGELGVLAVLATAAAACTWPLVR